jgi:hypothetical protein
VRALLDFHSFFLKNLIPLLCVPCEDYRRKDEENVLL